MEAPGRSGYPFTDPLGAAVGKSRPALWLMRRALIVGYALGALTLAITLLTPDTDTSDHTGIGLVGALMLLVAVLFLLWRPPPDAVLLARRSSAGWRRSRG
jgi:hypothetical protein